MNNPNVSMGNEEDELSHPNSSKRHAQMGQWITPPQLVFPSDANDYQTLQSAYRRGAEYAATLSQQNQASAQQQAAAQQQAFFAGFVAAQQQPGVVNNASGVVNNASGVVNNATGGKEVSGLMGEATSALKDLQHESCPNFQNLPGAPPMPQMFPQSFFSSQQKQPVTTAQSMVVTTAGPPPPPVQILPPQKVSSNRSNSLPNIASYAVRETLEDEKRQKRLARNRASARLRRLKKKNLVDSYVSEVTVLESSLKKLQCHQWGSSDENHHGLLEALSMDRGGQQSLSLEERNNLITDILKQQGDQVDNLLEAQMEFMALHWLLQMQQQNHENVTQEEKDLQLELEDLLQLSDMQRTQLSQASDGVYNEYMSLTTIQTCIRSLLENEYLVNPNIEDVFIEPFMSIFHPTQVSKFLLWCDQNADAIDQLDFVNAPQESDLPNPGPKFVFGIEEGGVSGNLEDEEKEKH